MADEQIEFLETEEIIEAGIVAALRAAEVPLEVIGALTPESDDVEKTATLSQIGVTVDTASQELDWQGPNLPCTYTARISVRVVFSDDKTGTLFRAACRAVRGVLQSFTGDQCAALSADGFTCDGFMLDNTQTALETIGDGEGATKTYVATVRGRTNNTQEAN